MSELGVGKAAGGSAGTERIGIFGGTFDPPHIGHLIVAQDAWSRLELDRLIFIPASAPPHKVGLEIAPAALRLEMLRAAIGDDPRFDAIDLELRRSGPSYTVDTLRELRTLYPAAELSFLLGADQFRELHTWREPSEIVQLAQLVVLSRGGEGIEPRLGFPHRELEVTRIDLSATEIRNRVAEGRPIRYLVPEGVAAIVEREGLYRV